MAYRCKKYLSLLLTIALINSSIQPLYASFPEHEDEVVRKAGAQARLVMLEDALQNKIKSSATLIESWTPSFVKNAVSKLGTWVESTLKELPSSYFAKSPLEIDYGRDRALWLAHFSTAVDDIQEGCYSNNALHARLVKLQNMVFNGLLSPYVYEKGLQDLERSKLGSQALFKNPREEFKKALKTAPGFIDQTFRREAGLYIQDLQTGRGDAQEFISHIRYYRDVANALDYKDTLTTIRSYLREHKGALKITKKEYEAIIATLNLEIGRIAKNEKKRLKDNQAFSIAASSELPYYGQEWDEIHQPTNNALPELSKEKGVIEGYLDTSAKALRKFVHTGAKYAQEHPTQALMMALAGQVAAAAAFKAFAGVQVSTNNGKQTKGQESPVNEEEQITPLTSLMLKRAVKRNIGDEFLINQNTTATQRSPSVVSLTNGNAFVIWKGDQAEYYDIYGRVFSADGTALGSEFGINQNTTLIQGLSSVASLRDGNVFAIWQSTQSGTNYDIYGRIFSSNGTALSNDFRINQNLISFQAAREACSVAGLSNGNALVAWEGDQTVSSNIYGRIFSPNGTALSNEFALNQDKTAYPLHPFVAGLNNGNVFIVWESSQAGTLDIYGRIFSANGTALSNELVLNQDKTDSQRGAALAELNDGKLFVTWYNGILELYGRLLFSNGTAYSDEFIINQNITSENRYPTVAPLRDGNALVTWHGRQNTIGGIFGRVFSSNGTALNDEFLVNQITAANQQDPYSASLADGNIIVVWDQPGGNDVFGRILTPSIIPGLTTTMTSISAMTMSTTGTITSNSATMGSSTTGIVTTGSTLTGTSTTDGGLSIDSNDFLVNQNLTTRHFS